MQNQWLSDSWIPTKYLSIVSKQIAGPNASDELDLRRNKENGTSNIVPCNVVATDLRNTLLGLFKEMTGS